MIGVNKPQLLTLTANARCDRDGAFDRTRRQLGAPTLRLESVGQHGAAMGAGRDFAEDELGQIGVHHSSYSIQPETLTPAGAVNSKPTDEPPATSKALDDMTSLSCG